MPAGFFPSTWDSFDDGRIDLNELSIVDAASTFTFRITGDTMEGCAAYDGGATGQGPAELAQLVQAGRHARAQGGDHGAYLQNLSP